MGTILCFNFPKWVFTSFLCLLKTFSEYMYRSQYDGPDYIQKKRKALEKARSSVKEREAVIRQLKVGSNVESLSFFVCRNPVAHIVSVYNHIKRMVEAGLWVKFHGEENRVKKFPSWEEFLRILTWPKSKVSTLLHKKMQTVGIDVDMSMFILTISRCLCLCSTSAVLASITMTL